MQLGIQYFIWSLQLLLVVQLCNLTKLLWPFCLDIVDRFEFCEHSFLFFTVLLSEIFWEVIIFVTVGIHWVRGLAPRVCLMLALFFIKVVQICFKWLNCKIRSRILTIWEKGKLLIMLIVREWWMRFKSIIMIAMKGKVMWGFYLLDFLISFVVSFSFFKFFTSLNINSSIEFATWGRRVGKVVWSSSLRSWLLNTLIKRKMSQWCLNVITIMLWEVVSQKRLNWYLSMGCWVVICKDVRKDWRREIIILF